MTHSKTVQSVFFENKEHLLRSKFYRGFRNSDTSADAGFKKNMQELPLFSNKKQNRSQSSLCAVTNHDDAADRWRGPQL